MEFEAWMKKEWSSEKWLPISLKDLSIKLRAWNMATFGNIFMTEKRNELRLGVFKERYQGEYQIISSHLIRNLERKGV